MLRFTSAVTSPILAVVVVCYWRPTDSLLQLAKGPCMVWDFGRMPAECTQVVFLDTLTDMAPEGTTMRIIDTGSPSDLDDVDRPNKSYEGKEEDDGSVKIVFSLHPCTQIEKYVNEKEMKAIHRFVRLLVDHFKFNLKTHRNPGCDAGNEIKGYVGEQSLRFSSTEMGAGRADIDVAAFCPSYQRAVLDAVHPFDFGPVYSVLFYGNVIRRPVVVSEDRISAIFGLLSAQVWLAALISLLITSLIYWLMRRPLISLWSSLFAVVGLQLLTGDRPVRSASGCLLLSFCLYSIVITTAFSADLLNILVLPQYSERVDTNEGVYSGGYFDLLLSSYRSKSTLEEARASLARDLDRHVKATITVLTSIHYVSASNFYQLADFEQMAKYRLVKEKQWGSEVVGVVFRKSVPIPMREDVRKAVQQMFQAGLYDYAYRHERRPPQVRRFSVNEDEPSYDIFTPLKLHHLKPLFYLQVFGIILAHVILLLEIALKYLQYLGTELRSGLF